MPKKSKLSKVNAKLRSTAKALDNMRTDKKSPAPNGARALTVQEDSTGYHLILESANGVLCDIATVRSGKEDADLFAAAPDLLAVVEAALEGFFHCQDERELKTAVEMASVNFRAVIRKTKGGKP